MNARAICIVLFLMLSGCFYMLEATAQAANDSAGIDKLFAGKWVRITPTGAKGLEFKSDGLVEVDFGNDGSCDVRSGYNIIGDKIIFSDREGEMCPEAGTYSVEYNDCYLAFDLVDDMCNGRVKMTMGFWTRPNFNELLDELSSKLAETGNPELNLSKARIYLAAGNAVKARAHLDEYIRYDTTNARAYINRAGTRFPADMEGVVSDCDKAILLEPGNKNAWFLKGLANYEMGNKKKACADFLRAIELGFSILKIAEKQRCHEFWQEKE